MTGALHVFWREMFLHLWQCTLVLLALFALERALSKAPAKARHAFWSIGLLKLFLPLSLLGSVSGRLAAALLGPSLADAYHAIPSPPFVGAIINPLTELERGMLSPGSAMDDVLTALTGLWVACVLFFLVRMFSDLRHKSKYDTKPLSASGGETEEKLARTLNMARIHLNKVVWCDDAVTPFVAGVFKPRIFISENVVRTLSEDELYAVLLHEESHRRRYDPLRSIVYRSCAAFFFFYPLLYPVYRRLTSTAEFVCDERVLEAGVPADRYSCALARVVRLGIARGLPAHAATGNSESVMLRRIRRLSILTPGRLRMTDKHRFTILVAALLIAVGSLYPLTNEANSGKQTADTKTNVKITYPELVKSIPAEYPATAKKHGIDANVVVVVTVDEKGAVSTAEVVEAYVISPSDKDTPSRNALDKKDGEISEAFVKSVLDVIYKWEFKPGTRNGVPSPVEVKIPVHFRLGDKK